MRVEKNRDESYRVCFRRGRRIAKQDFDAVVIALPHNWLSSIEWGSERLRRAMTEHIAYYDRPAHYLRISVLFKKPFWRRLFHRLLVHARRLWRLLRVRRRRPARRRRIRCAGLAVGRSRCSVDGQP